MRLAMKHVLVSFSLALVAVFAPNTPYSVDDVARRTATTSTLNGMPSTENNHQREVHAVVVDMPQRASLEFASPDTGCSPDIRSTGRGIQQNRYCR